MDTFNIWAIFYRTIFNYCLCMYHCNFYSSIMLYIPKNVDESPLCLLLVRSVAFLRGAPPPPPYPLATGVLLVPEFIYMLPWRRASVAPNCAITAMSTGEFWEANSRKEVWTGHSKLSCRKRSYKMASNAGDDSLYPIAVLIDELRNEDVQV